MTVTLSMREMLHSGVTDGTVRIHRDVPIHAGRIGVVVSIGEVVPLFQVRFSPGESDLFLEYEVDVLECHPVVSFLHNMLDSRFWILTNGL